MLKVNNNNELLIYPTWRKKNKYTVEIKNIGVDGNVDSIILKNDLSKEKAEEFIYKLEELLK